MASILLTGSFLAGSLLTILLPIGLLIALLVWQTRAVTRVPNDPSEAAVHAAGPGELEGRPDAGETSPPS